MPSLANSVIKKGKKHIPPSIDRKRLTPQAVLNINTANKLTTKMLQRAISSAICHGLELKAGILNAVNGSCLFAAVINNVESRECFETKITESSKELK